MAAKMLALVTGGNKGIGLNIVRQLVHKGHHVIIGTRNLENGIQAVSDFDDVLFPRQNVEILELDITDNQSIENASKYIEQTHNSSLDLLINNAGIAFNKHRFDETVINDTLNTNLYGTVNVTKAMLPFIKERIIFVTSRAGALQQYDKTKRKQFLDDNLSEKMLFGLVDEFKKDAYTYFNDDSIAKDDIYSEYWEDKGWPKSAYAVSKTAVSMYSRMLAKDLTMNAKKRIFVCAYCPGMCATDMTHGFGDRHPVEGAFGVATLATMLLDYGDDDVSKREQWINEGICSEFDCPNGNFWTAFYQTAGDLNSMDLENVDWINPSLTLSWKTLLNSMVVKRGFFHVAE